MRRIRTTKTMVNVVEVNPDTWKMIAAISHQSQRSEREIIDMAIRVFATATRHMSIMHPPPLTKRWLSTKEREKAEADARAKCAEPITLGKIMLAAHNHERSKTE
jgi:hypothetical protein